MRDRKRFCEATKIRADGVVLVQLDKIFVDQHHPGASRHPSSAEEGTLLLPLRNSFTPDLAGKQRILGNGAVLFIASDAVAAGSGKAVA